MLHVTESGRSVAPASARPAVRDDVLDRLVLGQVAVGACLDELEHGLIVVDRGQHHDPGSRPAGLDGARGLHARAVGKSVDPSARRPAAPPRQHRRGLGRGRRGCPTIFHVRLHAEPRATSESRSSTVVVHQEDAVASAATGRARTLERAGVGRTAGPSVGDPVVYLCTPRAMPASMGVGPGRAASPSLASTSRGSVPDNRAMRIAFLGLGLIGGSVARALRAAPAYAAAELVAWTPSAGASRRAGGRRDRHGGRRPARRRAWRGARTRRRRRSRARRWSDDSARNPAPPWPPGRP